MADGSFAEKLDESDYDNILQKSEINLGGMEETSEIEGKITNHEDTNTPEMTMDALLTCSVCQKTYSSKNSFARHHQYQVHLSGDQLKTKFHCDPCDKYFFDKSVLQVHNKAQHSKKKKKTTIDNRGKFSRSQGIQLRERIKISHNNIGGGDSGKYICTLCKKSLSTKQCLVKHHYYVHSTLERQLKTDFHCEACGKYFYDNSDIQKHNKVHHSGRVERPFICETCGNSYRSRGGLRGHMNVVHKSSDCNEAAKYSCKPCQVVASGKGALQTHLSSKSHWKQMELLGHSACFYMCHL